METARPVRIGFAAFDLGNDLHLTIGRRYDASDTELVDMQKFVDDQIKPRLPFTIHFGNFCHMGETGNFPAYKVYFVGKEEKLLVEEFYHTFYKEGPNKALYPWPKFHVTCDTPFKRQALEALIRENPVFKLERIDFKTRVDGVQPQIAGLSWLCPICASSNSLTMKVCSGENCDQWRPNELARVSLQSNNFAAVAPAPKIGDWTCPQCNFNNFASRTSCKSCNRERTGVVYPPAFVHEVPGYNPYTEAPSAPVASVAFVAHQQAQPVMPYDPPQQIYQNDNGRGRTQVVSSGNNRGSRPDWFCNSCRFKVFGSKDRCGKCGTRNPHI